MIAGSPLSINQVRELLSETYDEKLASDKAEGMKGFIAFKVCEACKKKGHTKADCWVAHPDKKPKRAYANSSYMKSNRETKLTCWKCGKPGHTKKECRTRSEHPPQGIVAAVTGPPIIHKKPIYLDSACSCHLMADLSHLKSSTVEQTAETITAVGGQKINLTRKGTAEIPTMDGMLRLSDSYYAPGLDFSLVSVPQLVQRGVCVYLSKEQAYIKRDAVRINLQRTGDLWALPMRSKNEVVALSIQRKSHYSAEIWHRRLGHASTEKMIQLARDKLVPEEAAQYDASQCDICSTMKPMRRPVPNKAERSGEIVVQVDYMPMGQGEIGWKGEVGAYVYSCRISKILKAYPVRNATAQGAAGTLKDYLLHVTPYLKEKITCIQMDAGSQFTAGEWVSVCASHGLKSRSCPVNHQEMNGQVERMIGILATKMRSLLGTMEVPSKYWPLAIVTAAYLLNRTPSVALGGRTPLEAGTGEKPDLRKLKVFGYKAFVQIPKPQRRGKLKPTAWQGMMVGYSTTSPEWIILDTRTNTLRNAYSVVFSEHVKGTPEPMTVRIKELECSKSAQLGINVYGNGSNNDNGDGTYDKDGKSELSQHPEEEPPLDDSSLDEKPDSSWEGNDDGETNDQTDLCPRRTALGRRQNKLAVVANKARTIRRRHNRANVRRVQRTYVTYHG